MVSEPSEQWNYAALTWVTRSLRASLKLTRVGVCCYDCMDDLRFSYKLCASYKLYHKAMDNFKRFTHHMFLLKDTKQVNYLSVIIIYSCGRYVTEVSHSKILMNFRVSNSGLLQIMNTYRSWLLIKHFYSIYYFHAKDIRNYLK